MASKQRAPAAERHPPLRDIRQAAGWIDRKGFALLMPHRGLPLPSLWEGIRGRPGGHPFKTWTKDADLLWEWKDALPAKRLAFYGSIWLGKPGFVSLASFPSLLKLWACPLGLDGFRAAYREGTLSFDANRLGETLFYRGPLSTYRLRKATGLKPNTCKRALVELQRKLVIAKCGTDDRDTEWPAEVVDLSARVFPRAHLEARELSYAEARESALAQIASAAPALAPRQVSRLLKTGLPEGTPMAA